MRVGVGVAEGAERGRQGRGGGAAGQTLGSPGAGGEGHSAVVVQHGHSDHAVRGALGGHVGRLHLCCQLPLPLVSTVLEPDLYLKQEIDRYLMF